MGGLEQWLERCDTKEIACMAEVGHLPADPSHKKVALLIAVLSIPFPQIRLILGRYVMAGLVLSSSRTL